MVKIIFIVLLAMLTGCAKQTEQIDLLIRSGLVYDGTNRPAKALDIGICGKFICYVEASTDLPPLAKRIIDARGMIVSPGFIDPHTHSTDELNSQDKHHNLNYLFQGVTTVVNGNDGGGPIDIIDALEKLNSKGIGTNTSFLVGHGSLRRRVMGTEQRHASAEEIEQMKALLEQAMQQGALGLSSGLYYVPGSFAAKEEVVELAKVAAKYNGIYDTHLRDESTFNIGFLAALDEAIEIAQQANIHLHVAHIKALGVDVWGQSRPAIDKINHARDRGLSITADQYPWRASGTFLRSAVVPKWAMADSNDAFLTRLDNLESGARIKLEIVENIRRRGGAEALLITASDNAALIGKTLKHISQQRQLSEAETVVSMVKSGFTRVASFNMNESDIQQFMQQPWVVTSSDGTNGHPRKYASFPQKYQQYVKQNKTIELQRFIYSSSGQTASILGMSDRGVIAKGKRADLLVFDPEAFKPIADFKNWNRLSQGVSYILVNGQVVIDNGNYTNTLAGEFVPRQR